MAYMQPNEIEDPSHIETHDLTMHKYKNGIDIRFFSFSFLFLI